MPASTHRARQGISQARGEGLRGLGHHAVAFELEVAALVEDQVEGVGGIFQLAQGDIVAAAAPSSTSARVFPLGGGSAAHVLEGCA